MVGEGMRTALVLGGASCLARDVLSYCGPVDGVVACNEAGIWWPRRLDAWVSFHPRYFERKGWRARRAEAGYSEALRYLSQEEARPPCPDYVTFTSYLLPGQDKSASSGIFSAKVALVDLGFDRVVLCGVPMDSQHHFWDESEAPWRPAQDFAEQVKTIDPEWRARMRSMSGWTREFLGAP